MASTATLGGRYLPVTATVAAWNPVSALARQLKGASTDASLDGLRVQVLARAADGQATGVLSSATEGTAAASCFQGTGKTAAGSPGCRQDISAGRAT